MSIKRYGVFGLLGAAALALLAAQPAAAHVTVQPGEANKGSFAKFAFRVPNESDTAGTIKLEVRFPLDTPVSSLRTKPMPGWTAEIKKETLPAPIKIGNSEVTQAVRTITWTAQPGVRLDPGEFTEFEVSGGPLPDAAQLMIPAVQTYDDGKVVSWDAPQPAAGGEEPEHPAPVLKLVAAPADASDDGDGDAHDTAAAPANAGTNNASSTTAASDKTARWLGGIGLVVGALGLGVGAGALLVGRRRAA